MICIVKSCQIDEQNKISRKVYVRRVTFSHRATNTTWSGILSRSALFGTLRRITGMSGAVKETLFARVFYTVKILRQVNTRCNQSTCTYNSFRRMTNPFKSHATIILHSLDFDKFCATNTLNGICADFQKLVKPSMIQNRCKTASNLFPNLSITTKRCSS